MAYAVALKKTAAKELEAIAEPHRARIRRAVADLATEPRPVGCLKLEAAAREGYRIRIGDYRVKYTVDDATSTVVVHRIGHRREIYR